MKYKGAGITGCRYYPSQGAHSLNSRSKSLEQIEMIFQLPPSLARGHLAMYLDIDLNRKRDYLAPSAGQEPRSLLPCSLYFKELGRPNCMKECQRALWTLPDGSGCDFDIVGILC